MTDRATRLHDLLLGSDDISGFLDELVVATAGSLTGPAGEMWCAILLVRPKRPATVASSAPRAQVLDEVQFDFDEDPCLTAAREDRLVYLTDTHEETRWPKYRKAAAEVGVRSALGVPLDLGGEADLRAALSSRTSIDLAAGILMGRHRCSQQVAVEMLRRASNQRNVKLRDLAAELVRSVGAGEAATHFDD